MSNILNLMFDLFILLPVSESTLITFNFAVIGALERYLVIFPSLSIISTSNLQLFHNLVLYSLA